MVKFFPFDWEKWPLSSNLAISEYEPPPIIFKEPAKEPPKFKSLLLSNSRIVLWVPPVSFCLISLLFSSKRFPFIVSPVNVPSVVIDVWAAVPIVPTKASAWIVSVTVIVSASKCPLKITLPEAVIWFTIELPLALILPSTVSASVGLALPIPALLPVIVKTWLPAEFIATVDTPVACLPEIPALVLPICQPFVFPVCSPLAILLTPLTIPNWPSSTLKNTISLPILLTPITPSCW